MRLFFIFLILFFCDGNILQSQIINKEPLSERITGYKIDAKLDPVAKNVTGVMEAFWVNRSADVVPDIQMHLYMNAFRSSKTTLFREYRGFPGYKDSCSGWVDIKTFTDDAGNDLIPLMQFISPDDGNPEDRTVIKVLLPNAAQPGDTVSVKVNFETKLPSSIMRTGYDDDFFFVAQWFPKFGVYEPAGMRYAVRGGWNCHQFHAESEFYSDHSVYDVKITVPKEYVVGSGGMLTDELDSDPEGKNKTLVYRAEDIPDFAWTAWPGYVVFNDKWEHVNLTLLLPEERIKQVDRQFTAVKNALEYLTRNVGPYPWPHLTFVDPPAKGSGSSGMEYTTLFTSESFNKMPDWYHFPEMVTVHEFGHAYFMGILASNEFEEPWMDEGMDSFWEARIMDHYYGENSGMINLPLLKIPFKSTSRLGYVRSEKKQLVSNIEYSWNYPSGTYEMMSYNKVPTWLYTLMGIVGEETMNEIFREYYKKWAFKHPCGKDFINVVNEVVKKIHGEKFGPDMNWFFDQTLYGTGICDYKVAAIINGKSGMIRDYISTGNDPDSSMEAQDSLYSAVARIERTGEVTLPVDVLIHFTDGNEVLESWDGKSRFKEFEYRGSRKIQWVKVDPEFRLRMDVNFINNSMTLDPDRLIFRRMTNKIIALMQFFISVFTF